MNDIYVPAIGPRDAKIVFVGEAPDGNEERAKTPFVGYSGQLLRNTLSRVGIDDRKVYITNTVHFRPPGNDITKWFDKRGKVLVPKQQVIDGVVELYRDLSEIRPVVIVPLGNTALWALTGVRSIGKRRGSILSAGWDLARARVFSEAGALTHEFLDHVAAVQGTKVIPTYHPTSVLKQMDMLAIFQTDLGRIKSDAEFPELRLPEREFFINPPEPELNKLVMKLLQAEELCYDIECIGNKLYCIGFACDPSWALTITADSPVYLAAMRTLLSSKQIKIAQNGIFDWTFLSMYTDIVVNNYGGDTMVAQHAAYPSLPKGLDFLCSIYTREPYYKDEGKNWSARDAEDVLRFLTYNAKDVCSTLEIWQKQKANELRDPGYRITHDRVMSQMPAYAEQTVKGIRIDQKRTAETRQKYTEDWRALQKGLDEIVLSTLAKQYKVLMDSGKKAQALAIEKFIRERASDVGTPDGAINVNSTKILRTLLFQLLGMKEKKNRKTGALSTDEDALKELYAETLNPVCLTIVKIRQLRKRVSAYLLTKTDNQGVTHFSVNPVKAKTGRSATGKTITGEGLNVQTVPHELRYIYIPDAPGYKFAYMDLDQAEARIVAYRGGISRMIWCFERKLVKYTETDVHSVTAHNLLQVPYDQIKEYPHRYLGKRCNHAFNYEMGPEKFYTVIARDAADTGVSLTRAQAKQMRLRHLQTYPELQVYWEEIRGQLRKDRTIINPLGRKRVFLGRLDADTFREAFSHYAQSTVRDVIGLGMVAVYNGPVADFRALGYTHTRVVLEGHDALLLQYHEDTEAEFLKAANAAMRIPMTIEGREIVIPVGCEVGWNYGGQDESNPNGLRKHAIEGVK